MKYWLFELEIFAEGENEGVGVRQVIESDSDLPPLHKVHELITNDCPVPLGISFKSAYQIDKECFDYFNVDEQKECIIE